MCHARRATLNVQHATRNAQITKRETPRATRKGAKCKTQQHSTSKSIIITSIISTSSKTHLGMGLGCRNRCHCHPPCPLLLSSQSTTPRGHSQGFSSLPRNLAYMHSAIARCIACSPSSPPAPLVPPHDTTTACTGQQPS